MLYFVMRELLLGKMLQKL